MSLPTSPNKESIQVTFPSGRVANKIINLVVHNKPVGVSRRSQYPYYKENYAKWIKPDIDRMIETNNELVYDYSVFCTEESNISPLTLYARISQGIRYLVDNFDDDKATYYKWYESVEICKNKKLGGVAITWKPEFMANGSLHPRLAESVKEIPKWRRELVLWLEGDKEKPFKRENLMLDIDTIRSIQNEFEGVLGVMMSIDSNSITVVKVL
jgi:hypothetical protein